MYKSWTMCLDSTFCIALNNHKSKKCWWHHSLLTQNHCQFFGWSCVSLIKFSCWSKFLVNIIIGFGVMTIFLYKGFDQKSGNWKYPPSEVCTITGDCGKLEIPNLAWIFLMKIYLMLQNVRFTVFIVYKWKWVKKIPPTLGLI